MDAAQYTRITNYIWGIADDVLRDVYVRGKYRDVILPVTVLRRLDTVLEPTREAVLHMKKTLDEQSVGEQGDALRSVAGQAFYNTSPYTLADLRSRTNQAQLRADFETYLDGFSSNVQDIIDGFEFRNQIPKLSKADVLGELIEKLIDPSINLGPQPVLNPDGSIRHEGLDNHGMGTVFEDLVRRFNEENNEEAGEHWTPRDIVKLTARLVFEPIKDELKSGSYLMYDGCAGTGGMLSVGDDTVHELLEGTGKEVVTHLYGQEINAETYAICKADMILKGDGQQADNFLGGPEYSTLSNDAFADMTFDFMLSNPPYGKSWKTDMKRMGDKEGITDTRFIVSHKGESLSLLPRSSDGQMLFLANQVAKMKHQAPLGSRIASIHNGSSLFTGDSGSGESNTRRYLIENDWLEAIVALPLNIFYNTGIATYIWVISNRKPAQRKGKVQLIDASKWFCPLRRNLGHKNCELGPEELRRVMEVFRRFQDEEGSIILSNQDFGYQAVTVERPLRLRLDLDAEHRQALRELCQPLGEEKLADLADSAATEWGEGPHLDYNHALERIRKKAREEDLKLIGRRLKLFRDALTTPDEDAMPVIKKLYPTDKAEAEPLYGKIEIFQDEQTWVVEYESDSSLRDSEQVPLTEAGGVEAFFTREVLPYAPDAWLKKDSFKLGYEISFNRYFYKPPAMRSLEEIRADILALEAETEDLLEEIVGVPAS